MARGARPSRRCHGYAHEATHSRHTRPPYQDTHTHTHTTVHDTLTQVVRWESVKRLNRLEHRFTHRGVDWSVIFFPRGAKYDAKWLSVYIRPDLPAGTALQTGFVIAVKEFIDDYSVYSRAYLARLSSEFEFCADADGRCADRGFQEFMRTAHLYGVNRFMLEISLEVEEEQKGDQVTAFATPPLPLPLCHF